MPIRVPFGACVVGGPNADPTPTHPVKSNLPLTFDADIWFKIMDHYDGKLGLGQHLPRDVAARAEIALPLLLATDQANYAGPTLLNPGGLGGAGTFFVNKYGIQFAKLVTPGPSKCTLYAPDACHLGHRITEHLLRPVLFRAMYQPIQLFPGFADVLVAIETRAVSALANMPPLQTGIKCDGTPSPLHWPLAREEVPSAIPCSAKSPDEVDFDHTTHFKQLIGPPPFFAPVFGSMTLSCDEWKIPPRSGTGPDPVTPLEHARAVAARYGRAKLVVQKSVGHSTFASAPSLCAVKHLRAYYANGTMPEDGVV
ncbi:hypothetical protein FIBSPDRAFT_965353 [Athelia psychrophila]|uniref:Peptidase S33 tripeptidyl aminopeptidase-like C-terminal domain-containing protein n=1 Tax=Athelia psychrophila TaxID=1759441 RepID=A0A165WP87_9AGAM|nr:hypothetical protein FIBSPDRAFT_965353 [Fibularhizoctonia sp. CBS 109695]